MNIEDPRWRWLRDKLAVLAGEIGDDERPVTLAVTVECGEELLFYAIDQGPQIMRRVVTDIEAAGEFAGRVSVNIDTGDVGV